MMQKGTKIYPRFFLMGMLVLLSTVAFAQSGKPNVVLMVADNVGYGDIGAFQGGEIRGMPTPRIDKLASEGLILTQFLTEPGCTPSRAGEVLDAIKAAGIEKNTIAAYKKSLVNDPNPAAVSLTEFD